MIWKIQACKTILRRSRCQLKPKTLPHLHMCPSVCFYTLFFQPVGEVVFIQAAVWSFFFTHQFPFYHRAAYFKVHVICLWTHIHLHSLSWVFLSLLEGELIFSGPSFAAARTGRAVCGSESGHAACRLLQVAETPQRRPAGGGAHSPAQPSRWERECFRSLQWRACVNPV